MSASNVVPHPRNQDHKLGLGDVLRLLVQDGMITKEQAEKLFKDRKQDGALIHPLVVIAEQQWKDLTQPGRSMTAEYLTEWLAGHANLPYYHIDPLQLNFGTIAHSVSKAYAERLKILPIKVSKQEITIATAEPYQVDWVHDLERMLKLRIKRVLANPLEINRYLPEVYNLASSASLTELARL